MGKYILLLVNDMLFSVNMGKSKKGLRIVEYKYK